MIKLRVNSHFATGLCRNCTQMGRRSSGEINLAHAEKEKGSIQLIFLKLPVNLFTDIALHNEF